MLRFITEGRPVIPIPIEDKRKAQQVVLGILEASDGTLNGKVRLFKAFYFAHLFYYQKHEGLLSDYPIVRMPKGPAIDRANSLLADLIANQMIEVTQRPNGPYVEQVYIRSAQAEDAQLTAEERDAISEAVKLVKERTAEQLSEYVHEFSNTWWDTRDGSLMNVYADLLSESEYESMKQRQHEIKERINAARQRRSH